MWHSRRPRERFRLTLQSIQGICVRQSSCKLPLPVHNQNCQPKVVLWKPGKTRNNGGNVGYMELTHLFFRDGLLGGLSQFGPDPLVVTKI